MTTKRHTGRLTVPAQWCRQRCPAVLCCSQLSTKPDSVAWLALHGTQGQTGLLRLADDSWCFQAPGPTAGKQEMEGTGQSRGCSRREKPLEGRCRAQHSVYHHVRPTVIQHAMASGVAAGVGHARTGQKRNIYCFEDLRSPCNYEWSPAVAVNQHRLEEDQAEVARNVGPSLLQGDASKHMEKQGGAGKIPSKPIKMPRK
ncbi:hypothetical protein NDU88_003078 [Pleurodeles waltl]|uniref:Uncharacterized protein n=1 Tax=Pleurodeles waltl TaxID=8319 RepID=A0AAV7VFB3_PLEWA|nr:hypothetical protein NDU88_003078 [Pleurodeles waltl]